MKPEFIILILGMGVVTFLPRWFPLFFLSGKRVPKRVEEWLDLIPVAILSALLLPELVTSADPRCFDILNLKFAVAIPTLLFALKTKSLGGTIIVGMSLFWITGTIL